ncbi:MAG: hypothetical protein ACFWTZ_08295 [Burkholderia sp.]|jgi:chemotaxis protein MotB
MSGLFKRAAAKRRAAEPVNYLANVSDLMSALLFVFILTLMLAISQTVSQMPEDLTDELNKAKASVAELHLKLTSLESELQAKDEQLLRYERGFADADAARRTLLTDLRSALSGKGIDVGLDLEHGVLILPETAVTFDTGSAVLNRRNHKTVEQIGEVFAKALRCYIPVSDRTGCTGAGKGVLDAVFIEGHTDNQKYWGDDTDSGNRQLSTMRANAVYEAMVLSGRELSLMSNSRGEPLFSLSGYGSARPRPGHDWKVPTNDPVNRRIEFRFLISPAGIAAESEKSLD